MRHALRSLAKSPGFTSIALLTLALGIGANTTSFSVLNALLLHVPGYPQPGELVRVMRSFPGGQGGAHAPANFLDYRDQNTALESIAAIQRTGFNLGEPGQPANRVPGLHVTSDFFPLLRVTPILGRVFTREEERPGHDAVVILAYQTWLQRFNGDPGIVGRVVRLDGAAVTVIGVLPATFDDPQLWGTAGAFRPLVLGEVARDRDNTYLAVIGRLKPDGTPQQAEAVMNVLSAQLASAYPQTNRNLSLRLVPLAASQDEMGRQITWLVAALSGFVLLIACANLANLQFARNAARAREHAIRAALGASRLQLVRSVLTESLLLSLAGGTLGLLLALWTNDLVGRSFLFGDTAGISIPLDRRVLAFTFIASVLTGIAFGLLPAWLASRADVNDALKQGGRGTTGSRSQHRIRHALIVAEVALALILLAGAGFFMRGLQRFAQRDPGWRPDGLLTATIGLRGQNASNTAMRDVFLRRLHERLAAVPGIDQVAIGSSLPTSGFSAGNSFVVEGQAPPEPGAAMSARVAAVTPGYFETLGIRLLQGRDFSADDTNDKPMVVVINESMARKLWPGQNPIGKRIGGATPFMSSPREVIGVVSDVRSVANLDNAEGRFQFYRALTQWNMNTATIALRSRLTPEALAQDLRQVVAAIDPDQAVFRITTVRQEIAQNLGGMDAAGYALVWFAALGVLLAAVGIYGVVANSVVQRTNEIGIRMALGAQVRDVLTLVLGGGLRLTLIGVALGLAGAFGLTRLLTSISPEFSAAEPALLAAVTALLIAVALFACWLPARRATRVDPISALRAE